MKTILVIEDQPQMRSNIVTILELEGFKVQEASHGAEGLAIARKGQTDLILCDVMMPHMDGREVLRALRAGGLTATIPFIFLTANGAKEDFRDGMNLGADDYLTKPVSVPELISAVQVRLKRAELLRTAAQPDFTSPAPLLALGLTPREAEVLLWAAQGKGNADIAIILEMSVPTVKKHLEHIFSKIGVENRSSATLCALEALIGQGVQS
jgi:DNA-binding NarL/FixJ family response regulator